MENEVIIGLEVHAQLSTATKLFCGCRAEYGGEPNTRVCPAQQAELEALLRLFHRLS